MKTEAWTLLSISLPKRGGKTLARSKAHVKIAQSKSQFIEELKYNSWLIQTVPLQKQIQKKVGQGLQ